MESSSNRAKAKLKQIKFWTERFAAKHIIWFVIIFIVVEINDYRANSNLNKSVIAMKIEMKELKQSFVAIDTLGRILNLPRTFVTPENKEKQIAEVLSLLLVDRQDITEGFSISEFKNATDIADTSTNLQEFLFNYVLVHRNSNEKIQKYKNQGMGFFQAYSEDILKLFKRIKQEDGNFKELPHQLKINKEKTQVQKYEIDREKNEFSISVNYSYVIFTYKGTTIDKTGKEIPIWEPRSATANITAKGYFDIQTHNKGITKKDLEGKNSDGLHFYEYRVNYGL